MAAGDVIESMAELYAGLVIFSIASVLLYESVISPSASVEQSQLIAQTSKSVTYSKVLSADSEIHDQKVGRIPGIDPTSGYTAKDSGLSRMYFRPEQFIMLPAVDTDTTNSPNVASGRRTVGVVTAYNGPIKSSNAQESWGWLIASDPLTYYVNYRNAAETLTNKQLTFNSLPNNGVWSSLLSLRRFTNVNFGSQSGSSNQQYGGFNLTVDASIDPITKKKSNSVIFVAGRVPSK